MKLPVILLAIVFAVTGFAVNFSPLHGGVTRTEEFIAKQFPPDVEGFKIVGNYKMPPETYQVLEPFGIVSNFYSNGPENYDVTVIGSNKEASFHDPRICFSSQGLSIEEESVEFVRTQTHGTVPFVFTKLLDKNGTRLAAYTYRGPGGKMLCQPSRLANYLFYEEFKTRVPQEAVFLRFISTHDGATKQQLLSFIQRFLDTAGPYSKGYL